MAFPPEMWRDAVVTDRRPPKKNITLRIDPEIIDWFKARGTKRVAKDEKGDASYSSGIPFCAAGHVLNLIFRSSNPGHEPSACEESNYT